MRFYLEHRIFSGRDREVDEARVSHAHSTKQSLRTPQLGIYTWIGGRGARNVLRVSAGGLGGIEHQRHQKGLRLLTPARVLQARSLAVVWWRLSMSVRLKLSTVVKVRLVGLVVGGVKGTSESI